MPEPTKPPVATINIPKPKGLTFFNTKELTRMFFHFCIYAETSMRKTTKLAEFCDPKKTLYILTRKKEQLIPIRSYGFEVAQVEDSTALSFALMYPEKIWKELQSKRPDLEELQYVALDDATEAVNLLVEGEDFKDQRKSYNEAGKELREILRLYRKKPVHFGMTALAKVRGNAITGEENVLPELPPSMLGFLTTELEFTFYVKPDTFQLLTDRDFFSVKGQDESTGKEKTFRRVIFAKNKLPKEARNTLLKVEAGDLKSIWAKIEKAMTVAPAK